MDAAEDEGDDDKEDEPDGVNAGLLKGTIDLSEDVSLEAAEFQKKWGRLQTSGTVPIQFKAVPRSDDLEEALENCGVITMASGTQGSATKYYLYAQEEGDTSTHFLVELVVQSNGQGTATIRSDSPKASAFIALFERILKPFQ